jgi:hypothetical protein
MADNDRHIVDLAPELALGTAAGDERAVALEHMARCAECRRLVLELAVVTDSLLELAPVHEPPIGFESRVLSRLIWRRGRRAWIRTAAAAVAAAVLAAGGVLWFTSEERRMGTRYLAVLDEAGGDYFAVHGLYAPDDSEVGHVFAYEGKTPWLYVVMDADAPGTYRPELVTVGGRIVALSDFDLGTGERGWGAVIPLSVHDLAAFRLTDGDGTTFAAPFGHD